MYELDKELARKILIQEGRSSALIELTLKDFPPLHESLVTAANQWLNDQTVTNIVVDGLAIKDLMKKRRSHFLAALRDLNILLDENVPIEKRRRFSEILRKPIYYR